MTLVFDEREVLGQTPMLHAFIVGVSDYTHLPADPRMANSEPPTFGLSKLTCAASSAYRLYEWLITNKGDLASPLGTCRLLLSPVATDLANHPEIQGLVDRASRDNFIAEAAKWREDASLDKGGMTLFYFCGHGIQKNSDDAVMLFDGFGSGDPGGVLAMTAEVQPLFSGMAPSDATPDMALTQLYFLDCCRVLPERIKDFDRLIVPPVFDRLLGGRDDRRAPIYYAAVPDSFAYAFPGGQTLFSEALMDCLDGQAGRPPADGDPRWRITTHSISEALDNLIPRLNTLHGADQSHTVGGWVKSALISHIKDPPTLELTLQIDPDVALPFARVSLKKHTPSVSTLLPKPLDPHPYSQVVQAGIYTVSAKISPRNPNFSSVDETREYLPPRVNQVLRMAP